MLYFVVFQDTLLLCHSHKLKKTCADVEGIARGGPTLTRVGDFLF